MARVAKSSLRGARIATCAGGMVLAISHGAVAQGVSRLVVFGDSYADTGNQVRLSGMPLPPIYVNGRFSNGANFVDGLQASYGLPDTAVVNYAVGGAKTDATNVVPGLPGLTQQVSAFRSTGGRFGPGDLAVINIGGNDLIYPSAGGITAAQAVPLGQAVAANAVGNVAPLVAAGARTIVFNAFSSLSPLPVVAASGNAAAGDVLARSYFNGLQEGLAPFAQAGTRIFLLDNGLIGQLVQANPGRYGFANVTVPCTAVAACIGGSRAVQNTFLSYDGVHLTEAGYLNLARYMVNVLAAPNGIAAQAEIGQISTTSFGATLLQRLDAMRLFPQVPGAAEAAAGMPVPGAAPSPVIVWGQATYAGGTVGTRGYATGFDYDSPGGMVGIEATPARGARFGLAFNYLNPDARLRDGGGSIRADAFQFAAYGSYTGPNLFGDAAVVYGRHDYAIERPGVVDQLSARTTGNGVAVVAKGGYLFDDWNGWRVGPIVGLGYANTRVNGYTERGDPGLTQSVRDTGFDTLVGRAGAQIRTVPLAVAGSLVTGFLNVTAEHQFLDGNRILVTTLTATPLLPIQTPLGGLGRGVYGQVEGGLRADLSANVSATLTGATTFARTGGDAFAVSGGLTLRY